MSQRFYRAIAYQSPDDGPDDGWDVIFPDFPGCVSQGDTAIDALKNGTEALALHIEGMIAENLDLPPESRLDEKDKAWVREIAMERPLYAFLNVTVPGKRVRLDVTMDRALVERLDAAAGREGTTRSGFLSQAVREKLKRNRETV